MSRTQAWEKLNDSTYSSSLNMSDFYELLIKAGYSIKVAQDAANKRGWQRLEAGLKM